MEGPPEEPTSMSTVDSIKKAGYEAWMGTVNSITGPSATDQFETKGMLTPEQFVAAGDLLTSKCKTWTWEGGDPSKAFPYLPEGKQFLLTRGVPCVKRAKDVEGFQSTELVIEGDDVDSGWAMTASDGLGEAEEIPDLGGDEEEEIPDLGAAEEGTGAAAAAEDSDSDIPDLDDYDDECLVVEEDPSALGGEDAILKTRTYNIYITYDQYHATPKVYLEGFDEANAPLTPELTFQDISSDYVHKTVSTEIHPHLPIHAAYIHPCRHAEVMKRLTGMMRSHSGEGIRADQSLFLFLKFISSVIPTIQYDFTSTVDVGGV